MLRPRIATLPFAATGLGLPNQTFKSQIEALNPRAWWEYRDDLIVSSLVSGIDQASVWNARTPAVSWAQADTTRQPARGTDKQGMRFKADVNGDVMVLTGANFPTGDHTLLVVQTTDVDETGNSYMVGDVGATDTRHGLYCNTVGGGSINAGMGPGLVTQGYTFGVPTYHLMGYRGSEKTTFLETMGGALSSVTGADVVTPTTACFMGGGNAGGSMPFKGRIHAGVLIPECVFALDPTTATAQAAKRAMLKRYAQAVIDFLPA